MHRRKSDTNEAESSTRSPTRNLSEADSNDAPNRTRTLHRELGNQAVRRLREREHDQSGLRIAHESAASEREADRVSDAVLSGATAVSVSSPAPSVNRESTTGAEQHVHPTTEAKIHSLKGGGQRLPKSERSFFQRRFSTDLSDVRIHTSPTADQSARSMDAVAFTHGRDIGFRTGAYNPESRAGRTLLAHELTHVAQQRRNTQHTHGSADAIDRTPMNAGDSIRRSPGNESTTADTQSSAFALDPGIVHRSTDDELTGGYTPANQGGYSSMEGGYSSAASTTSAPMSVPEEADQRDMESPGAYFQEASATPCSELDSDSRQRIQHVLEGITQELDSYLEWRNGESWGTKEGQQIPDIQRLEWHFSRLLGTTYRCADDPTRGIPASDPLVKDRLFRGFGYHPGLSPTDINYINEWMRYTGPSPPIADYFGLSPEPLTHNYGMQLELGSGFGAGWGGPLGGKLETPIGQLEAGCFVDVEAGGQWFEFSYSNELGMTWTAEYLAASGSAGANCGFSLGVLPIETSFGTEDLCSDNTSTSVYYGPGEFGGVRLGWEVGAGAAVGVGGGVSGGTMTIYHGEAKPPLTFDLGGACARAIAGGEVDIVEGEGIAGLQFQFLPSAVSTTTVEDVFDLALDPIYERVPTEEVVTRHLYYDTGSSDTLGGTHANENMEAIRELTAAIDAAGSRFPPDDIHIRLTGHASPRWRSADDEFEAAAENQALAGSRAWNARSAVLAAYLRYTDMGGWPDASFEIASQSLPASESPAGTVTTENLGSSVGLAETGDPESDAQRYRRVTVQLHVYYDKNERLNTIDFRLPRDKPVLYCRD